MFRLGFSHVAVLVAITIAACASIPAFRNMSLRKWHDTTGWNEQARQEDPDGFMDYVQEKLQGDLAQMQKTRRELASEIAKLSNARRVQEAQAEQAQRLADEFRDAYQTASAEGGFPIELRGQAYTESQVQSQVGLLLALADSHQSSLNEVVSVQQDAEKRMEDLAVQVAGTQSQLELLATKQHLLRVRELSREGQVLLAQVDDLMNGNADALADYPVRTPEELLAADGQKPAGRVSQQVIQRFLNLIPVAQEVQQDQAIQRASAEDPAVQSDSKPQREFGKPQGKPAEKPAKPIFQQS